MRDNLDRQVLRGAKEALSRARTLLTTTLTQQGPMASVGFPETAYYLPTILAITGRPVTKVEELSEVLEWAERLLKFTKPAAEWNGAGDRIQDVGLAALLAAEAAAAMQFPAGSKTADGRGTAWIDDVTMRSWGARVLEGRIPGFALVIGRAKSSKAMAAMVAALRRRNITCFLVGSQHQTGIVQQLADESIKPDRRRGIFLLPGSSMAGAQVLGLMARIAMGFGEIKPGKAQEMLRYCGRLLPGFVLALESLDETAYAMAAGAMNFGLPVIASGSLSTQLSSHQAFALPFKRAGGRNDRERAESLVRACIEVSAMHVRDSAVILPVEYGPGFGEEVIDGAQLRMEFGGPGANAFELVETVPSAEVVDGMVALLGPDLEAYAGSKPRELGLVVRVAGRHMRPEFEPVLEERLRELVNEARGIRQVGHRDWVKLRISEEASRKGFSLEWIGRILQTRLREEYGSVVDKAEVRILTDPQLHAAGLLRARAAYRRRDQELANLSDESVEEFYGCTRCQSAEPAHVCLVSPERAGACGVHNWLSCRAMAQIDPGGPIQVVRRGSLLDRKKGYWDGVNVYVKARTQGAVNQVAMHSMMENPMTACGCLECVAILIPEANGIMIVSREDESMTPAGMTFEAVAELACGRQTPGVMGMAKSYLVSPKFIAGDGGFRRVVWISQDLKKTMSDQLRAACLREGDPELYSKIADGQTASTVPELLGWLRSHDHPAMRLEPIF